LSISVTFSADAENITLFEYHGSFQTNNETYDRFERWAFNPTIYLQSLIPRF